MKNTIYIIMAVMLTGCAYQTVEIATPTTQCGMCDGNIIDALNKLDGVKKVKINDAHQSVIITYLNDKTTLDELETAISKAGYQANDKPPNPEAYGKLNRCCKLPKDRK
jgi:copper chaperone CopZ